MITTYHRPTSLQEALTLLAQRGRVPLGGGTLLSKPGPDPVEVVDLQALGLDTISRKGNVLEIGATVTLQELLESSESPGALKTALRLEAPLNLRNAATIAGTLVSADGRSTLAVMMLALDAKLEQLSLKGSTPESKTVSLGEYLPLRHEGLITSVSIPMNVKLAFDYVSRTPADKPIVCTALAQWNSGRTRLALGGFGRSPMLAMDGTEAEGIETAARNAFHEAADEWGSAEYRMDVAATLARRCLDSLQ